MTSESTTSGVVRKGMVYSLLFAAVSFISLMSMSSSASAQVSDQGSNTDNGGTASANTGANGSGGNTSDNNAASGQSASTAGAADDGVSNNSGSTSNGSGGSGNVATGDASAVGNRSGTGTNQTTVSGVNGSVVIVDQDSDVSNTGVAAANTGGNVAVGNASTNTATNNQAAAATGVGADDSVAANNGSTTNNSNGIAGITTGDADAVGNDATNNTNQVANADASGGLGGIVIIDQETDINNTGVGVSNTGGNVGVGNASDNTATSNQAAAAVGSISSNNASTSNSSDGTADISTGDASSTGSTSNNNVSQIANASAGGSLGGIVIIDQDADVTNAGVAASNTGLNGAVGNASTNRSNAVQGAVSGAGPPADDSVASNNAETSNWSGGSASITTGAASATGNSSTTNITQTANASTTGALGGVVLVDQEADVTNAGVAFANTGGNIGVGNASDNDADATQTAVSGVGGAADDSVAANFAVASNQSDGTAEINTGNATATGNASTTNIAQVTDVETNGLALIDQDVDVTNTGIAVANTGLNAAVGNASTNDADNVQTAVSPVGTDETVAANFGETLNDSDGWAGITTGSANAIGNDGAATTNVAQVANVNGSGLTLTDQEADVDNTGIGVANTGLNAAVGNASNNDVDNRQRAFPGAGGETVVAANFGTAANNSNGTAEITTGAANGVGNRSTTNIAQVVDVNGEGLVLSDQDTDVTNTGLALANTGFNLAVGNASVNDADNNQRAATTAGNVENIVAANFAEVTNNSDGSASVSTGAANAVGNDSAATTNIAQTVDANIDGSGFVLADQDADVTNTGAALANTGANLAVGNVSVNDADNRQRAFVSEAGPGALRADDVVASNNAETSNWSNGSAEVTTGAASATGNASTTNIAQATDANIDGNGFTLTDQDADVTNTGLAAANTGVNAAIGNASDNDADNDQRANVTETGPGALRAEDVVASNNAATSNTSDGTGRVTTGAAWAMGNDTTDSITQVADANIDGNGFVLADQDVDVVNTGAAVANTGVNAAIGNASDNDADNDQRARVREAGPGRLRADDVVASNVVEASNNSNGTGEVTTGAASAIGNESNTNIAQASDSSIDGNGFVLLDQEFDVTNTGVGIGNSGINAAIGNVSDNDIDDPQRASVAEFGPGNLRAEDVVASNVAESSNNSDGTGTVTTGEAHGVGNRSSTTGTQIGDGNISGNGFVLADQDADVTNTGLAIGNSGLNLAVGNASDNDSDNDQRAFVQESGPGNLRADDVVASNVSSTTNDSDGTASITTGVGHGIGNQTTDTITQGLDANIDGNGFVLADQEADVTNAGVAIGNSGLNLAAGNVSDNDADNVQRAAVRETGPGNLTGEDVVASNVGESANRSDGSASINTGCACAVGNNSLTNITQATDANLGGTGFALVDQDSDVTNAGVGIANSGLNFGVGNASDNDADNDQAARVEETGAGALVGEDVVASNVGGSVNDSDGSVDIVTGNVTGIGNWSATGVVQAASVPDEDGLSLVDQDADLVNTGLGVASSGLNVAAGNVSDNDVDNDQLASATGAAEDVVASNVSEAANLSNGSSSIRTGDAFAVGNMAINNVCQGVNTSPNCAPVSLPPLPDCRCPRAVPPPGPGPLGRALPRTGSGVAAQAMLGLLLVAMGTFLRRKARTA